MKIVDVKSAVMGTAWRNLTFVRVITDEGLEGVGENRTRQHADLCVLHVEDARGRNVLPLAPLAVHRPVRLDEQMGVQRGQP